MEQAAEEVKSALKRFFLSSEIDKEEYKDIMRKAVPKVCTVFNMRIVTGSFLEL